MKPRALHGEISLIDKDYLVSFGSEGSDPGKFSAPQDVAIFPYSHSKSYILVADLGNNRVQILDQSGNFKFMWGSSGSAYGQFNKPTGIATDREGNVYVVDSENNRVQKFLKADIDKHIQQ